MGELSWFRDKLSISRANRYRSLTRYGDSKIRVRKVYNNFRKYSESLHVQEKLFTQKHNLPITVVGFCNSLFPSTGSLITFALA